MIDLGDNQYACEHVFEDGRKHKTMIYDPGPWEGRGMVIIAAAAAIGDFDLDLETRDRLLRYSRSAPVGHFAMLVGPAGGVLNYMQKLPLRTVTPEVFGDVVRYVTRTADRFEYVITGKDEL